MKKFLNDILLFFIPSSLIYILFGFIILPKLLTIVNGPSTKEQIVTSFKNAVFKDYDILILGNSRIYRGLNPDVFSLKSYNFSHDNDSYNQIFHKMKYLEERGKKYKYLILGVDYFQFGFISDTRNYVYGDLLGDEYLEDYDSYVDRNAHFKYYFSFLNPKKLKELKPKNPKPFIKKNGQFVKGGKAKENDFVQRDIRKISIQINYFEKILELCNRKNIQVFLIMLPTRENELINYKNSDIIQFNLFLGSYTSNNIHFLNFSYDKKYKLKDYTDITHFNQKAADRFSKQLNDTIVKIVKEN